MAGWLTPGVPQAGAIVQNGTNTAQGGAYTQVTAAGRISMDTEVAAGAAPQTVAVSPFGIATLGAGLILNQGTSSAGAATLDTKSGLIITESLATAPGASYTFVLTNSLCSVNMQPVPQVALVDQTNTGGIVQANSVTTGLGTMTAVFQNVGTSAFNGTFGFCFHL